ncbi:MAG: MerR family DNA-binding transcriptional regulator [Rhodospirillaceae bacterium]|jgi:DNA-binding transcriptional MerR regulator|nr:MerR family DNA-binding transcriptional regulator [Rhodospirillaceae bacterium]MBT6137493.1 MerR family DNA-binding transcriptional regulator [Rhodospirillaceae bacterium]
MTETYSIGELAREFDMTTRAIRFYEEQELISPEHRGRTRVFSMRDRTRLRLIKRGRRLGFSVEEIRQILNLYDAEGGESKQLYLMISKIHERRRLLREQMADITAILDELDGFEERCMDLLQQGAAE